jgi:hypothetical protein
MRNLLACVCTVIAAAAVTIGQPAAAAKSKNAFDKGDFRVGFPPSERGKKLMPADIKEAFQEIADGLNGVIALPRDVYLNLDTCGEANAFYNPSGPQIKICNELITQYEKEFKTVSKDPKEVEDMVEDTLVQTLFHELGHCLIDQWDLPATGREEDAVDQLATVLLLDGSASGQKSAINAALEFAIASSDEEKGDMLFWDEHSFSKTRFYDMLCLVYGSNPSKNAFIIGDDTLPKKRAERCPGEYKKADHAWMKLLQPYILQ